MARFMSDSSVQTPERKRGRPRRTVLQDGEQGATEVSREGILDVAFEMTKTMRLGDISFVQIARKMGITPGSVHYHVGTRDQMTAIIITRCYQKIVDHLDEVADVASWEENLRRLLHFAKAELSTYPGLATHLATTPERHLFKPEDAAGIDYGARYMDRALLIMKDAGLSAENAAQMTHWCNQLILSSSFGELERSRPEDNREFVMRRSKHYTQQPEEYPGLSFGLVAFAQIDTERSFEIGVDMIVEMVKVLAKGE